MLFKKSRACNYSAHAFAVCAGKTIFCFVFVAFGLLELLVFVKSFQNSGFSVDCHRHGYGIYGCGAVEDWHFTLWGMLKGFESFVWFAMWEMMETAVLHFACCKSLRGEGATDLQHLLRQWAASRASRPTAREGVGTSTDPAKEAKRRQNQPKLRAAVPLNKARFWCMP